MQPSAEAQLFRRARCSSTSSTLGGGVSVLCVAILHIGVTTCDKKLPTLASCWDAATENSSDCCCSGVGGASLVV